MSSIAITKPASKPKWAQVAVKYNCKKLSKQRKLTKRSGRIWKADQLFWETLQEHLGDTNSCRFCQGDVNIMENLPSQNGLGSSWIILCQNESFPSQRTNSVFKTTDKGKGFEINRAMILGLLVIILKISQPIRKISNANRVNQKIISRLLTLEFWLLTWKSGLFTGK